PPPLPHPHPFPTRRSSDLHVPIQEHSRPQLFDQLSHSLRTHFLRRLTSLSQTVSTDQRPVIRIAAEDHPATGTRTLLCGRHFKRDRKSTRLNSSHDQITYA